MNFENEIQGYQEELFAKRKTNVKKELLRTCQ